MFIEGETGTGKGLVAEAIHELSGEEGKFVAVNCPSVPSSLFESELFGHCKGAFTDAKGGKAGLVEEAAGGTLFLDEITEIPLEVQGKLLRFVEAGRFRRVGETEERRVEVRIIAATNRDVGEAIREGRLRSDLFYRLSQRHIVIRPLRERREDIDELLEYYGGLLRGRRLTKEALLLIKDYSRECRGFAQGDYYDWDLNPIGKVEVPCFYLIYNTQGRFLRHGGMVLLQRIFLFDP